MLTMPRSLPRLKAGRAARGATLIEVMVAVLLVSFGILGLVGLHARAIQFSVDADDRNRAALFADELAAQMRLARSTTLPAAQIATWTQRVQGIDPATNQPVNTGLPSAAVDINVTSVNSATITIRWRSPGQASESRLESEVWLTNEEIS
jgi:type IV pilus assembly protein PilV